MSKEINLITLFNRISERRRSISFIILASIIISLVYAFSQEESFKTQAYLIPPESRYTQPLNVFLDDGYRLSRDEITPSTIYRVFMLNLQSRKYQRKYFFDNNLGLKIKYDSKRYQRYCSFST